MLLDVQDQLILLAAASSLSMTKQHAFFTFSTTPYDVTSLTLLGVTTDVTSEPRFTNDSKAANVNIFESVFAIATSFPQDYHKTDNMGSRGQRSKRDTSVRTRALKPGVSDSLTFLSEKDIPAIERAPYAPTTGSIVSSHISNLKWQNSHSNVYVISENDNLVNKSIYNSTAISPRPPAVHKNTHVPLTQSKDDLFLAQAQAEDPPHTNDIIDKSEKSSGFSQDEGEKDSPEASSWKMASKHLDSKHESWQSTSELTELQNSLFFTSEHGNIPDELPRESSAALPAPHIAGLKQRSKRDLQTFHLTDMDVNAVYDMVYILAYAVFRYVHNSSSGTLPNSYKLIQTVSDLNISGYSGMYLVDDDQMVTFDFAVYDFNSSSGVMERRVFYEATNATSWSMTTLGVISWPDRYILAPDECYKQVPNCNEGLQASYIAAIVTSALVLAIVVVTATLFIRRYWVNKEMTKGPNKVILSAEDLVFVMRKDMGKGSRKKGFGSNSNNSNILKSRATLLEKDNAPDLIRGSDPNRSMASINELSDYTETARFNGDLVHVKELEIKGFEMRSKLLTFIRMCRDLRHENLNPYVGFLADPVRPSIVMEYCSRGSLNDVIHNEDFKLDWDFKLSLLTDLVRGVRYLHSSPLKHHGHITSKNCVIDSRFVLKITDYGVSGIMERCKALKEYETRDLLWSAPELLRDPVLLHRGTDKGDLYAMAIIFQEVALRTEPYSTTGLTPEEVIKKLKKPPPLIRPSVTPQAAPPQFIQIMKQCWSEMPEMRPNIDEVYDQFKKLTGGKKANIVDTMFKMLEKYSTDLEDIVAERTMQLEEEKKKTDQLLFRMLPPTVAESLKIGRNVEAECFDEVTIYFSDIVGFTTISAMSTPMQVVDLLNDLYTMFDATINDHDVYKVETIGDAYMVVSGLPIRNGNRHAGEIGTLALVLLSQCGKFTIRHMPQVPLRLRIGLHTGSCVAGVVGLTMPRFCLFGDTVNTASRMESTGAAFRVHISQECKTALDILGGYKVEYRGQTELKGKGMHSTYWLVGKEGFDKELPEPPALVGDNTHGLDSILGDMKIDLNSVLSVPADSLGKSSSAPNLIANAAISEENPPKSPGFQEHHKDSCTSKNNTSVITADINVTGRGHHKESTASHGETLDTILEAGTGTALKNKHSESNDSGFGSERKHSHGNDTFTVGAGASSSSTGFGNDKLKRAKSSVVSSSDVSFHTNHSTVVDLGDDLTPVTEV